MALVPNIGRYEIMRVLGQGGMGRVLLARDSVLGRHVAIKILRDDLGLPPESREALFARMRQEARAAAAIAHPHIVTLHDMGEEPEVGLYLVFEYVTGPTLRDKIGEGPLDTGIVAKLARRLGDALTTAHDAGVIHRDVKPENVILSPYGAILTDFGIARLGESTLTTAGSVLGTPAYSAPEALALAEFGPATDQFSLAATVFEALSAVRAFPGDDALAIASRIATEPTPSFRLSGADPRLVTRIDAVLGRALAKDPAFRFPSCRAFGEALALAIEARTLELPTALETPVPRSIVPRATRRVHNLIAAVALLVIVGLVLLGRPTRDGISLRRVVDSFGAIAGPSRASATDATPRRRPHGGAAGGAGTGAASLDHTGPHGEPVAHDISHDVHASDAAGGEPREAGAVEPEGLDAGPPN